MPTSPTLVGSEQHDVLNGLSNPEFVVGLAGDDSITTGSGADVVVGDYLPDNLLTAPEGAINFAQYGASGDWQISEDALGRTQMSQSVETLAGAAYEISFELAANHAAGVVSGAVEVLWNDTVIGTIDTSSAIFADQLLSFTGTGGTGELTFRALPSEVENGPVINTDGPIFWYEKTVNVGGTDVSVQAFAEGQNIIYQVLNGRLHAFDPVSETYTPAGASATVVTNCIGFNQEDDLIYGIAVSNGTDALGNPVGLADLVMIDAGGNAYRVGDTPYRSWTGDFDENGNLWSFHSSMDRVTMIDVDDLDADGYPRAITYKFPKSMITDQVWDVAYDAATDSFYGLVRPQREGADAKLMKIDISDVANGGEPEFSILPVTATDVNGTTLPGVPAITFGAFVVDGDGNFYAGGNGGDHDMNDATGSSGGIYRVDVAADGTSAQLVLVSDAPKSYSNDGAVDPRAMDPFAPTDPSALVLIRGPELTAVEDAAQTYDDVIDTAGGADTADGGFGDDTIVGAAAGDTLIGGVGDDALYGGAGPNVDPASVTVSIYDANGQRYTPDGVLLPENDDLLIGGAGNDMLDGSAGHDTLDGGTGGDTLQGGSGHDVMQGGSGDDTLSGGSENDVLDGGDGQDILSGGQGADTLIGGTGNDSLTGNSGDDSVSGDAGADTLTGGLGNDTLNGGADDDDLAGHSGNDVLNGDAGNDALAGGTGDDVLTGGTGDDTLLGSSGADTLAGSEGSDSLNGGSGNDSLSGGEDRDTLNGGSGDDTIEGGGARDRLVGYHGNDLLDGGADRDLLYGGNGDDTLLGAAGNDKLFVGRGADTATGGEGSDTFVFRTEDIDSAENVITDFTRSGGEMDVLDFRNLDLEDFTTQSEWITQNLTVTTAGDVMVQMNSASLLVRAHGDLHSDALYDAVVEGLWL